jgi:hypothetical protein
MKGTASGDVFDWLKRAGRLEFQGRAKGIANGKTD